MRPEVLDSSTRHAQGIDAPRPITDPRTWQESSGCLLGSRSFRTDLLSAVLCGTEGTSGRGAFSWLRPEHAPRAGPVLTRATTTIHIQNGTATVTGCGAVYYIQSGRPDLNRRPPEPHSGNVGAETRQNVRTARCFGHRRRVLRWPVWGDVARNSQQNSQHQPRVVGRGSRLVMRVESSPLAPDRLCLAATPMAGQITRCQHPNGRSGVGRTGHLVVSPEVAPWTRFLRRNAASACRGSVDRTRSRSWPSAA